MTFGPNRADCARGTTVTMADGVGASPAADVDITMRGSFPGAEEYANIKIGGLGRFARNPITHARLRLTQGDGGHAETAVVGQVNLDFLGRHIRAQVAAATAREVIDKLEERARRQLEQVRECREPRRGPAGAPPWRQGGALPVPGPNVDGARISRRKSFAMAPCTVDEALTEMDLLDYDFHLFNEIGSGAAAVVYRGGPTGLRLALVAPALSSAVAPFERPVTISPHPVPCLREDAAVRRMALMNLPFLFYIDAAGGRASVLYRRLDGDLAVITPAG